MNEYEKQEKINNLFFILIKYIRHTIKNKIQFLELETILRIIKNIFMI